MFKNNFAFFYREISTKSSDTCNLDESSGLFCVNEAFTFESIDTELITDLAIQLDIINYRNKQIIGKVEIEKKNFFSIIKFCFLKSNRILSTDMFENRLLELDMFSNNVNETYFNNLSKSKPNIDVSVESLNSGSLNSRRRQLPQIPLEKQRENRDKSKKTNSLLHKKT